MGKDRGMASRPEVCAFLPVMAVVSSICLAFGALAQAAAAQVAPCVPEAIRGMRSVRHEVIPAKKLRGYGELSGEFTLYEDSRGAQSSVLAVRCESREKAGIAHAKYLSDLQLLGGVQKETVRTASWDIPAIRAELSGQLFVAARYFDSFFVITAPDKGHLEAILAATRLCDAGAEFNPSARIPMYLDSWDKYGFRFYYREFETPPPKTGQSQIDWVKYEVLKEFDFAKACGDMGFIFWHNDEKTDLADGMTNENLWGWAARAAANRNLPVIINSFIGDSTWHLNRFRGEEQGHAPHYCGGFYTAGDAYHAGKGHISWCAGEALDAVLSVLQGTWRRYAARANTIEFLEPHGELRHGEHDILTEYGPLADESYRSYLRQKYRSIAALSRRWYGQEGGLRSWRDVRLPELAHFLGFDADALDLAGEWRFRFEEFRDGRAPPVVPAPESWYMPDCDDSIWPSVCGPQSDEAMFLPRRPAVWRRRFHVPARWREKHAKAWLYVFSLNRGPKEDWPVYLNGRKVGSLEMGRWRNWSVMDVTDSLTSGDNLLALRLPEGFIGYRVYLTGAQPKQYPYLGEHMNAQWVDFIRWQAYVRREAVRRGMEAIREVTPEHSIICMAPDSFQSGIKVLCEEYGGHFHNTGYMSGWWSEQGPMQMRSCGLPFSLEPGGPAPDLPTMKSFLGHWLTEGVNAVHYYIHVGSIFHHDEIRPWFEDNTKLFQAFGKMHIPRAEIAMLFGDETENLVGWPWGGTDSCGYVPCQFNCEQHKEYHMDAVTPLDFKRGNADRYRVILDTNTYVMDEDLLGDIEAWVRKGGVFITAGQTGRHSPEIPDTWPISRLSGYKVIGVRGHPDWQEMLISPGQDVFKPEGWDRNMLRGIGLRLAPIADGCTNLMLWPDGSAAIGMRRLGKGMVFHVGCNYDKPPIRTQIFEWLGLKRIPGACPDDAVISTHYVSNNGLFDVWALWHRGAEKSRAVYLAFRDGLDPGQCIDLKSGKRLALLKDGVSVRTEDLHMEPLESRLLLTPRRNVAEAPLVWLELQRGWWQGTSRPSRRLPQYRSRCALELNRDWLMLPLDEHDDSDKSALAAPDLDDSRWQRRDFTTWLVPEDLTTHRAFFRKRFTVPAEWNRGEIELWCASWIHEAVWGRMRIWLDGTEISQSPRREVDAENLTARLRPGREHLLAIEVRSEGQVAGNYGNIWLYYRPRPVCTIDLSGDWIPRGGDLRWGRPVMFPGKWDGYVMARRKVRIDRALAGKTVMIRIELDRAYARPNGVMINGHWMMRLHHSVGPRVHLTITPWVKFGEENEITIVGEGQRDVTVREAVLEFFNAEEYP